MSDKKVQSTLTGSGTEEDPWFFPEATQEEGVSLAHDFMNAKGPRYRLRRQFLVDIDEEKVVEYWETDAGTFWFRYRKDP